MNGFIFLTDIFSFILETIKQEKLPVDDFISLFWRISL